MEKKLKNIVIKCENNMSLSTEIVTSCNEHNVTIIIRYQSIIRGLLCRKHRLPNSLYIIKNILDNHDIKLCNENDDGRVNSCMDEDEVVKILFKELPTRIYIPNIRMWYDILVRDYRYGWLPINIKSTSMQTSDNVGNLAMCVYAYTNEPLDLYKHYQNGKISQILLQKLKDKEYNLIDKKDYYFVVIGKKNNDIIINSIKGLTYLTPNINNLPFQVLWNKNRIYARKTIYENISLFINALQKPKPSWQELFMSEIRNIKL